MKPIKHDDDVVELIVIHALTRIKRVKTKGEDDTPLVVEVEKYVKEQFIPHTFEKRDIGLRYPAMDNRDRPCKKRTIIYCRSTNQLYRVAHSYEEVNKVLMEIKPITGIGFKRENK